jgi:hypothetical protein
LREAKVAEEKVRGELESVNRERGGLEREWEGRGQERKRMEEERRIEAGKRWTCEERRK